MSDSVASILLHLGVAASAFVYSAVGHGGASAYLAMLAVAGVTRENAAITALMLNILISGTSLFFFAQAKHLRIGLLIPFLAGSIPLAILGSMLKISPGLHNVVLALALTCAAARLWNHGSLHTATTPRRDAPLAAAVTIGALIGFASGAIGIGGGVFLSPILIFTGWAHAKESAGVSAGFILINSIAALTTRLASGADLILPENSLMLLAFAAGILGSWTGAQKWNASLMKRTLSVVLGFATIKLVQGAF